MFKILFITILVTMSLLHLSLFGVADDKVNIQAAKQHGRDIAQGLSGKVFQSVTTDISQNKGENDLSVGGIINFQGTDVPETKLSDGGMYSSAKSKIESDESAAMVNSAFLKQKDFVPNKNDSFLDRAKNIQKSPEQYIDWIDGKYTGCEEQEGEKFLAKETKVCDEYHQISENQCRIGQEIEVDAKHKYECSRKRVVQYKSCKNRLTVKVEKKENCGSQGITNITGANYAYPDLTLGRVGDDYWRDKWCEKITQTTSFNITHLARIEKFIITDVGYDDYLRISINGQQVYNGPYGGDRMEVAESIRWEYTFPPMIPHFATGILQIQPTYFPPLSSTTVKSARTGAGNNQNYPCELQHNRRATLNIDLVPYLKQGNNSIVLESIVGGHGESWVKIHTKQNCLTETDSWEEVCQE